MWICVDLIQISRQFLYYLLLYPVVLMSVLSNIMLDLVYFFLTGLFETCQFTDGFSVHGHASLATRVRNSDYFHQLLPLPIECVELDGDSSTLPIIFEDIYFDDLPVRMYHVVASSARLVAVVTDVCITLQISM